MYTDALQGSTNKPKLPAPEGMEPPKKRGPGRPRKNPAPEGGVAGAATAEGGAKPVKRGPGRPRKYPVAEGSVGGGAAALTAAPAGAESDEPPGMRGRPKGSLSMPARFLQLAALHMAAAQEGEVGGEAAAAAVAAAAEGAEDAALQQEQGAPAAVEAGAGQGGGVSAEEEGEAAQLSSGAGADGEGGDGGAAPPAGLTAEQVATALKVALEVE